MKYLLISVLIAVGLCSRTNTTNFFNEKVGHNTTIESWSGYEPIDWYYPESTASMYYSFWKVLGEEKITDPYTSVIIWLQGGPGAPSQFGCFNEVGPFHITGDSNFNVQYNSYSWNEIGHLVCVDQPVGIGFSYNRAKMVTDTHEASAHFLNFLYNFLNEWDLWKNPLYIAGESYAGHYIPAFVQKMLQNTTLNFNLKGVMIGDGYLDPINQVNFYDSMMYSLGVASEYARDTTTYIQNQAVLSLLNNKHQDATNWADWIVDNDDNNRKFYGGLNLMNYKKYTQDNINDNYWKFLQENKKSFGVPDDVNYIDDGEFMYKAFGRDISMSFADSLVYVIVYSFRF